MRTLIAPVTRVLAVCGLIAAGAVTASAQSTIGPVSWQLQPYCNVVTLTLYSGPSGFSLEGTDDLCGATNRGSALGVASPNAAGNYTFNFSIVTAPSGKPVHVSAIVSPANGSGTWSDSLGNSGTFAFFGNTPGLPARPQPASGVPAATITATEIAPGAVGASSINPAQVQTRVSGACPVGQMLAGVNADGSVTCRATPSAGPMKRSTFGFAVVPTTATSVSTAHQMATLTFTSPVAGTARVSARGYCNLTTSTSTAVNAIVGMVLPGEASVSFTEAVALRVPPTPVADSSQVPFHAERALAVTAGTPTTVNLIAYREIGTAAVNCIGSYTVVVHDTTLP